MTVNTQLKANLEEVLRSSFVWTATLLGQAAYLHCKYPTKAAEQALLRLKRAGEVNSEHLVAIEPTKPAELLYVTADNNDPPLGHLCWLGEKWFSQPSKPVRVWYPTRQFAKRHGLWAGRNKLTAKDRSDITHGLICSATWVGLLNRDPCEALELWMPEKKVESMFARKRHAGPVPDGIVGPNTCVEILGRYPKDKIASKLELVSQFPCVEVWGMR